MRNSGVQSDELKASPKHLACLSLVYPPLLIEPQVISILHPFGVICTCSSDEGI